MTTLSSTYTIKFALVSDDGFVMPIVVRPYIGLELRAEPLSRLDNLDITTCLGDAEQALHNCASRAVTVTMPNGDILSGQAILDIFKPRKIKAITSFEFAE